MASTRVKATTGIQVYHRYTASGDAPQVDVATQEESASGLGGTGDFEIKATDDITYLDRSAVINSDSDQNPTAADCSEFLYIENTGFEDAGLNTATSSRLRICIAAATSTNATFLLYPGQSVLFASPGTAANDVSNYYMVSSVGDIFVKMVCAS